MQHCHLPAALQGPGMLLCPLPKSSLLHCMDRMKPPLRLTDPALCRHRSGHIPPSFHLLLSQPGSRWSCPPPRRTRGGSGVGLLAHPLHALSAGSNEQGENSTAGRWRAGRRILCSAGLAEEQRRGPAQRQGRGDLENLSGLPGTCSPSLNRQQKTIAGSAAPGIYSQQVMGTAEGKDFSWQTPAGHRGAPLPGCVG